MKDFRVPPFCVYNKGGATPQKNLSGIHRESQEWISQAFYFEYNIYKMYWCMYWFHSDVLPSSSSAGPAAAPAAEWEEIEVEDNDNCTVFNDDEDEELTEGSTDSEVIRLQPHFEQIRQMGLQVPLRPLKPGEKRESKRAWPRRCRNKHKGKSWKAKSKLLYFKGHPSSAKGVTNGADLWGHVLGYVLYVEYTLQEFAL